MILTGPALNQLMQLCLVSIQKARSNITESYENYLRADPESYLARTFPKLFSEDARSLFNSWSKQTRTNAQVYNAICYVKSNSDDASSELYRNLIRAGYDSAIFHDTANYFGYSKVLSPAPALELPEHNFVIPRALSFLLKVRKLLQNPGNWVSFSVDTVAEDINGASVEFDDVNAVRWNLWAAKSKLLYELYDYDERWQVEIEFDRSMEFALREVVKDHNSFGSVVLFKVNLTHSELLNWLDWAIYHRHRLGPFY